MTPEDQRRHWLVRPRTIRRLWIGFALILAALVLADGVIHPHPAFGVDGSFGFYAWYGLLTCIAMVLVAKALGVLLKRRDDYYDERGHD
jgi:hypothetical protein